MWYIGCQWLTIKSYSVSYVEASTKNCIIDMITFKQVLVITYHSLTAEKKFIILVNIIKKKLA